MNEWRAWLGDIHAISGLAPEIAGLLCVAVSTLCGAAVGLERESRDKPAGLRTLILICLGSTIFTLVSLLLASQRVTADPARLAAQIIPGIGFLGAGAIIRSRGTVVGLTTGATIWAVAAIGVTVGAGYVVAGLVFTAVALIVLTSARLLERIVLGGCQYAHVSVVYRTDNGKTRPRLQSVLDQFRVPENEVEEGQRGDGNRTLRMRWCKVHREHRVILRDLVDVPGVLGLDHEPPRSGRIAR